MSAFGPNGDPVQALYSQQICGLESPEAVDTIGSYPIIDDSETIYELTEEQFGALFGQKQGDPNYDLNEHWRVGEQNPAKFDESYPGFRVAFAWHRPVMPGDEPYISGYRVNIISDKTAATPSLIRQLGARMLRSDQSRLEPEQPVAAANSAA